MNRQWIKSGALLVAMAAMGLVAGCGETTQPAKSTAPAASAEGKKVLKVACVATYPPFVYKDKAGDIVGFDVDITNAVAKEIGADTSYTVMPFDKLVPVLVNNSADIAIAACDMSQERADKVNFSNIYYIKENVSILAHKEDNTIKGPEDLAGKTVAIDKGTIYVQTAEQYGAHVKEYDHHDELIHAVENNEADALILDKPVAQFYMEHGAKDNLRYAGIISSSAGFVMMLNKREPELQQKINAALNKMMNNGEYDKIYDKWFAEGNYKGEPDVAEEK